MDPTIPTTAVPKTIKVQKTKYYSHWYWRVIFPVMLLVLLLGLLYFVANYPYMTDLARSTAANARGAANSFLNAAMKPLTAATASASK
jgi:hypothetical protein